MSWWMEIVKQVQMPSISSHSTVTQSSGAAISATLDYFKKDKPGLGVRVMMRAAKGFVYSYGPLFTKKSGDVPNVKVHCGDHIVCEPI